MGSLIECLHTEHVWILHKERFAKVFKGFAVSSIKLINCSVKIKANIL